MSRDPWKLVTSVDELLAGMTLELRPSLQTGKRERFVLLGRELYATGCPKHGRCRGWRTSTKWSMCESPDAIREQRLYALIDDDTAADETTVTRRQEMARWQEIRAHGEAVKVKP